MHNKLFFFVCFLIFSCDLPNEADADCNGVQNGSAFIDNCGECVNGNTGLEPNNRMNICGICYGPEVDDPVDCGQCGLNPDLNAEDEDDPINYNCKADANACMDPLCCVDVNPADGICDDVEGNCIEHDESLCIYDMCTDYLPESLDEYECDESAIDGSIYSVGEQLRCSDAEETYSICYPEDCDNTFKLADFYGKAIYILIETSWWSNCYDELSGTDDFLLEYLVNYESEFIFLNYFYDEGQPYTCSIWGSEGNDKLPIIINDGNLDDIGLDALFFNDTDPAAPKHIFINKDLKLYYKYGLADFELGGPLSESSIKGKIDEMLDEIEGD